MTHSGDGREAQLIVDDPGKVTPFHHKSRNAIPYLFKTSVSLSDMERFVDWRLVALWIVGLGSHMYRGCFLAGQYLYMTGVFPELVRHWAFLILEITRWQGIG